jgi:hypothetical protein
MDGNSFIQDSTDSAGYTDTRYAFTTFHVHGAPYKEGSSLTWEEKVLNMDKKILKLLKVVWASKRVALMHCQGHQKGKTRAVLGN